MDDVFRFADDLGPLKLVHIHPLSIRLKAVVAPDNIACGSAIGGVRMAPMSVQRKPSGWRGR